MALYPMSGGAGGVNVDILHMWVYMMVIWRNGFLTREIGMHACMNGWTDGCMNGSMYPSDLFNLLIYLNIYLLIYLCMNVFTVY